MDRIDPYDVEVKGHASIDGPTGKEMYSIVVGVRNRFRKYCRLQGPLSNNALAQALRAMAAELEREQ